jgi:acyl carrier protein
MTADPRGLLWDLMDGDEHARPAAAAAPAAGRRNTGSPATLVEQVLAGIFAHVLELDGVGVDESFFELGGDSLSAMRAVAAINAALDVRLAVSTFLEAPSVRAVSRHLAE